MALVPPPSSLLLLLLLLLSSQVLTTYVHDIGALGQGWAERYWINDSRY
jgi:hypothetical protein